MEPLEQKLATLQTELKSYFDKAKEQEKQFGTVLDETRAAIAKVQAQADAIDAKLVERQANNSEHKTLADSLKENESIQRLMRDKTGRAVITFDAKQVADLMQRKTTITSGTSGTVGTATSGVLQIDRRPGIVEEARQVLKVRDLFAQRPTSLAVVDYVKVNSPLVNASPQTEGSAKYENAVTFTTDSERIRTIATWIPATRQVLDDWTELQGFLTSSLPYYVNLEEEEQLVSGDDSGENLKGITTCAQAFDSTLLNATAGYNRIDCLARAAEQTMTDKEPAPTWALVHPHDFWSIKLTKDSYGRYLYPDGRLPFGFELIPTTSMTSGYFVTGNGNAACAEIRDRMGMQVEISTEHSDYFTKNLVAIRAEKRMTLIVYRGAAFVYGAFSTSPSN